MMEALGESYGLQHVITGAIMSGGTSVPEWWGSALAPRGGRRGVVSSASTSSNEAPPKLAMSEPELRQCDAFAAVQYPYVWNISPMNMHFKGH
jgi:hypothetical protein